MGLLSSSPTVFIDLQSTRDRPLLIAVVLTITIIIITLIIITIILLIVILIIPLPLFGPPRVARTVPKEG